MLNFMQSAHALRLTIMYVARYHMHRPAYDRLDATPGLHAMHGKALVTATSSMLTLCLHLVSV